MESQDLIGILFPVPSPNFQVKVVLFVEPWLYAYTVLGPFSASAHQSLWKLPAVYAFITPIF